MHLAAALGADPILLVGQDLAFTEGRVYARGSAYDMVGLRAREDGRYEFTGLAEKKALLGLAAPAARTSDELIRVEGWDGEQVPTSRAYASFLEHYRAIGGWLAAQGVRLVNCTEGGARIPGLEQQRFAALLEELAPPALDSAVRIDRAYAAAPRAGAEVLARPLAAARRALAALERETGAGRRAAERAGGLPHVRSTGQRRELLRGVARAECRVRDALEAVPWLDVLAEAARDENLLASRRSDAGQDASAASRSRSGCSPLPPPPPPARAPCSRGWSSAGRRRAARPGGGGRRRAS